MMIRLYMKDLFSKQAAEYRLYRPEYPQELYIHIMEQVEETEAAWDCGTGNGQVAAALSDFFEEVEATDISESQLRNAIEKYNVFYQLCRAEKTHFEDSTFDLITVAQAVHWFNFEGFYKEVRRVAKPRAVIAVWGYGLFQINPEIDALLHDFYKNVTGPYWDRERRHIDEEYKNIPFPFKQIGGKKDFTIMKQWSLADLEGFLNTWSAVQKYLEVKDENPVTKFMQQLEKVWPEAETKEVKFPIFLKMGRVH